MSTVPDPVYDLDAALAQGYSGFEVDPTPNENYSLQTPQDAPTPETDATTKRAATERAQELRVRFSTDPESQAAPTGDTPSPKTSRSSSSSESSESSGS
jgi:hypothetical protein